MLIIGHRGARGLAPENTLESLEAGIRAGADILEIDVRVTSDDVPVLHHDPDMDDLNIHEHTLSELRAHKPNLATLEDAIKRIDRRRPLILEVKPHVHPEPIVALLKQLLNAKWQSKDFRFASFDFQLLKRFRSTFPDISTVVLERWSGVRATSRAKRLNTPFLCMKEKFLWSGFVRAVQRRGYKLSIYTVNRPEKAKQWAALGVYAIVTDFPGRFTKEQSHVQ